jgi:hypothetical protein
MRKVIIVFLFGLFSLLLVGCIGNNQQAVEKPTYVEVKLITTEQGISTSRINHVEKGFPFPKPKDPTPDVGFKFVEWRKDDLAYDFSLDVNEAIVLTAYYEPVE